MQKPEPGITNEKKELILGGSRSIPPPPTLPRDNFESQTKICAIWGILETNLKKFNTLKFMMNISFVPSISDLPTPKYFCLYSEQCPYFQIFDRISCGCTTNQSKQNSVKGQFFYRSASKNSVWTHIFN